MPGIVLQVESYQLTKNCYSGGYPQAKDEIYDPVAGNL